MSRRERDTRDSDSRRHRSSFQREPSPKRSRRDGKPETERVINSTNGDNLDKDQKYRRRLQDALPLEAPLETDSKVEPSVLVKDSEKKSNGQVDGTNRFSDPTDVPRSRSYFQHDERGNTAHVGRSLGPRGTAERQWRGSKDDQNERVTNRLSNYDSLRRDGRSQAKEDDNSVWHHDAFFKTEAEQAPPVRKRPAFREKKVPVDSENTEKVATESSRPSYSDKLLSERDRREERDRYPRHSDRAVYGNRKEAERGGVRERYNSGLGSYRGRDRFSGRQGYQPGSTRQEKWKHDLYDEADKNPTTRNEEDQIAKVEALLAS